MGLIDLVLEVEPVFEFLRNMWTALPVAIQTLVLASFGGLIYLSVLRGIRR